MGALVLALNPSIDAEWRVDQVFWEEKNNVRSERRWAGGKGINVARWLQHLGGRPRLLLPLGGAAGRELAGYLRAEKISARVIRLKEPTRVNVIITTNRGRQMRFNPLGPLVSGVEWTQLLGAVRTGLSKASLLILSGSLPRGLPENSYAKLIQLAHRFGLRTLLDCDGPALAAAIEARPFLVKPNDHELAQWWGKPLVSEAAILEAARALSEATRGWVLVSRGARRSLLVHVGENFQSLAAPPRVMPRNTVGAGDALLAAVAWQIESGAAPATWLAHGLATGSAATQLPAGQLPRESRHRAR